MGHSHWAWLLSPRLLTINSYQLRALLQGFLLQKQVICLKGQEAGAKGPDAQQEAAFEAQWGETHTLQMCFSFSPSIQRARETHSAHTADAGPKLMVYDPRVRPVGIAIRPFSPCQPSRNHHVRSWLATSFQN